MTKQLSPLEALEIIKNAGTIYVGCASNIYTRYSFEVNIIEKALKALEIIKAKKVNVTWLIYAEEPRVEVLIGAVENE